MRAPRDHPRPSSGRWGCLLTVVCGISLGCGPTSPGAQATVATPGGVADHPPSALNPIPPTSKARWRYHVVPQANAEELAIEGRLDAGYGDTLRLDPGLDTFVRAFSYQTDQGWSAPQDDAPFAVPGCEASGCAFRYRFLLADAAEAFNNIELAAREAGATLSPPSAWLLRPEAPAGANIQFSVNTSESQFVTGLWPTNTPSNTYESDAKYMYRAPYSAFGTFDVWSMNVGGGELSVAVSTGGTSHLSKQRVEAWLRPKARAVASYLGRWPVSRSLILVLPTQGRRISGRQMGGGGASVVLYAGERTSTAVLERDWIAAHEMMHLAVPAMNRRHLWFSEGFASYAEPLGRAQTGDLEVATVWRDFIEGMPKGLPRAGDRGLDRTATWGRTYWGGALFCLLADLEIRRQTNNRLGLSDAMRYTLDHGASTAIAMSMQTFVELADQGTQTTAMTDLYQRMALHPHPVDLDALWQSLGVRLEGNAVRFDDDAPLSHVRKALTRAQTVPL